MKKTSLEKATSIFAFLLLPIERPSPLLLLSSGTGKKRSFDMAFNLDCGPLANSHTREDVDLNFACCQYLLALKVNRP